MMSVKSQAGEHRSELFLFYVPNIWPIFPVQLLTAESQTIQWATNNLLVSGNFRAKFLYSDNILTFWECTLAHKWHINTCCAHLCSWGKKAPWCTRSVDSIVKWRMCSTEKCPWQCWVNMATNPNQRDKQSSKHISLQVSQMTLLIPGKFTHTRVRSGTFSCMNTLVNITNGDTDTTGSNITSLLHKLKKTSQVIKRKRVTS